MTMTLTILTILTILNILTTKTKTSMPTLTLDKKSIQNFVVRAILHYLQAAKIFLVDLSQCTEANLK